MLQTDFLRPGTMPIHLEQMLFLLMCVGQILPRQMLCPCPRENKRIVLPTGKWRDKNSFEMGLETPRDRTTKEVQCREDTAGEERERTNSTRIRSLTQASQGIVRRKRRIPEKGRRTLTEASRLAKHDEPNSRRDSSTSQNGRRIWFQPRQVEERKGNSEARKRGARTQKLESPKRALKIWGAVVRFGQGASMDRWEGEKGANVTNRD